MSLTIRILAPLSIFFGFGYAVAVDQSSCFRPVNCTCNVKPDGTITFRCGGDKDYFKIAVKVAKLTITCKGNPSNYNVLPRLNESFFASKIHLTLQKCILPYKFLEISRKFPPIRKAIFILDQSRNISRDFFDRNSILTDLHFDVKTSDPPILHNLKKLKNLTLNLYCVGNAEAVNRTLFEENLHLKTCKMNVYGKRISLPTQLFHRNKAMKSIEIELIEHAKPVSNESDIESSGETSQKVRIGDSLFANMKKLKTVSLKNSFAEPLEHFPENSFANSTNLESILLNGFRMRHLSKWVLVMRLWSHLSNDLKQFTI